MPINIHTLLLGGGLSIYRGRVYGIILNVLSSARDHDIVVAVDSTTVEAKKGGIDRI